MPIRWRRACGSQLVECTKPPSSAPGPLAATVAIFAWAFAFLRGLMGPRSPFGELLGRIGLGVAESEILGYLGGMAVIVLAVLALGLLGLALRAHVQQHAADVRHLSGGVAPQ